MQVARSWLEVLRKVTPIPAVQELIREAEDELKYLEEMLDEHAVKIKGKNAKKKRGSRVESESGAMEDLGDLRGGYEDDRIDEDKHVESRASGGNSSGRARIDATLGRPGRERQPRHYRSRRGDDDQVREEHHRRRQRHTRAREEDESAVQGEHHHRQRRNTERGDEGHGRVAERHHRRRRRHRESNKTEDLTMSGGRGEGQQTSSRARPPQRYEDDHEVHGDLALVPWVPTDKQP